jgi:NTE family protein
MPFELRRTFSGALTQAVKKLREFAYTPLPLRTREKLFRPARVGLALGGGFARGLAHIGVLKVLVENHIPIDALAGTSVGSVVAAAIADGCSIEEMIEEARKIRWKSFARWTVARLGLATNERMEGMLRRTLHASTFEELSIPLAVVAADLTNGEAVVFRKGALIPPLRASCSFPGLFVPVVYQGRLLVDGAIVGSVPVGAVQELGVDLVIGVHLKTNDPRQTPTNILQAVGQAFQIAQNLNQATWRDQCDVVIEPDTNDFKWDDFERIEELILAGERAARESLTKLKALLNEGPVLLPRPAEVTR